MRRKGIDVLLVEDDGVLGGAVAQRLRLEGMSVHWAQSVAEALESLEKYEPALMLCDIKLPDGTGTDLYKHASRLLWETDVIFATAYAEIQQAIDLVKAGAIDYLLKPYDINDLVRRIKSSLTRAALPRGAKTPLRSFHYEAPEMNRVVSHLKRLANESFSILLVGESGTGKEMAARLIHEVSGRAPAPFIPVSCADIAESVVETKYFGKESDIPSDIGITSPGLLERVGTGTLFLDEICEMHPKMQVLLARALQDGGFYRLGGSTFVPFRGRVVAATNAKLHDALESGRFRLDLYYRLQSAQVTIPPLRNRVADIIPLTEHFIRAYGSNNPLAPFAISDEAKRALLEHHWPGNVRELMNRVVQACTLADSSVLDAADLFPEQEQQRNVTRSLSRARAQAEKEEIERVIAECGGRLGEAANRLGISRTTLWKRRRSLDESTDDSNPSDR
ncbi:sigma-54-dependent Fis family transcriptional regulator [Pusillimonas caeni]|uniref:sigma-54-dependent transcriptional regulator n=1 Tax=Pusillimonas caeni TaxID=1348472 RepID=UPI000E59D812|nr:sigma-54 dependent transcriptional regulator [Pusillimonas caeni]TFL15667.1 sigma-54-dependent Fis family transcriptional regulator [Pusillimonas caeni]